MKNVKINWRLGFTALFLLAVIACSLPSNNGSEESSAEQTLQAIYMQDTAEALAAGQDTTGGGETAVEAAFVEPEHQTVPGNPGAAEQTHTEIDTSQTADDKHALGDSFRLGIMERPFTEKDMDYHPETDLTKLSLAKGSGFYYFTIEVFSGSEDGGFPSASYGIEFDTDVDGRGDILLWAKGVDSGDWTVEKMSVLSDSNNNVGGSQPVLPDGNSGDGYDEVLFSNDKMDDPDAAWQRKEAGDKIQLAVKTTLVDAPHFMWKVWSDSAVADPTQFDYNDAYSESQAGSPTKNSEFYPVGQLNRMDSTCWINYGYELSGNLLGGCDVIPPPPPPEEPPEEPPPEEPPCDCSGACMGHSSDQFCCEYCGCSWFDSPEFTECFN